ncbi:MAG: Rpn family recombination-promoting nuclease/putative transposase [Nitrosopumilus sp.]|nr:Rpn family recombination-promoting nuclease/putative transposase [Nitrosopumilus sp.]
MTLKPARFLDPRSDVVFKKIFGQNPDLIKSFLNGILPLDEGRVIETITYLTPEQSPRIPTMKNTIVDVKCTDQDGRIFIVEMQLHWTRSFQQRLLFGASKAYVQQLETGQEYSSLCPVYGLGIINEVFDQETEEWFHHYRTVNVKDPAKVLKGLELVFLELPKFKPQTFQHKKVGILWLRFLREINSRMTDIPAEFMENPEISRAIELAQESSYTREELEAYDKYWDAVSVEKTFTADAFHKGKTEGKEEGEKIGEERGREEGRQDALFQVARSLLDKNMSLEDISKITGFSLKQLDNLLN